MKKVILLLALTVVVFSCKKETTSGGTPTFPEYIIGNWNVDDLEVKAQLDFNGTPITIDGESISTQGFYKFNSDKSFNYDWSSEVIFTIPLVFTDTVPVVQKGAGTYKIVNEDVIELTENGVTKDYDVKSKSPTLMIVKMNDTMVIDTITVKIDSEVVLSK